MSRAAIFLVIVSMIYLVAAFTADHPLLELVSLLGYPVALALPLIFKPFGRWLDIK